MILIGLYNVMRIRRKVWKSICYKCNFIRINLKLVLVRDFGRDIQLRMYQLYVGIRLLNLLEVIMIYYEFFLYFFILFFSV
jgi:hypothetical protein